MTSSLVVHWNSIPLDVSVHGDRDHDSVVLRIVRMDKSASTSNALTTSSTQDPHAARVATAATLALELDASVARSIEQGSTADVGVPRPRPGQPRTITNRDEAATLRPRIEELIAPLLFGPLPHPTLRPFQEFGVNWLMERQAAILADDMGLGKTAQALVALQGLLTDGAIRSALIVCPKSLLANWESESAKWTPALTLVRAVPGALDTEDVWSALFGRAHIILTSYEQLRPLPTVFRNAVLELIVADEAHRLRRAQAQLVRAFRNIRPLRFWALTGTPIERHPLDLSTLLSLLEPARFSERSATSDSELRVIARPYMLRRLKQDVLEELPEVIETKETIELSPAQRRSYTTVQRDPIGRNSNDILRRLLVLRSICDVDSASDASTKLDRVVQILSSIQESGEKAIVFSYLLRPLQLLNHRLSRHHPPLPFVLLTGEMTTEERSAALRKFKSDDSRLALLCSSRVGGEGLTLTEANHVIFVNEWWNPSANAQARDRVVRLGQQRIVHVHRFRCRDTVEELLDAILESKEQTFARVIDALATEVRLEVRDSDTLLNEVLQRVDVLPAD